MKSDFLYVTWTFSNLNFLMWPELSLTLLDAKLFFCQTPVGADLIFSILLLGADLIFANFSLVPDVFPSLKNVVTPRELSYL